MPLKKANFIYVAYILIYTKMVQAMINISENSNRVLNIVKAKFGLNDKSQAIDLVVKDYEDAFLEPKLRPEYKAKLEKISKGKHYTREEVMKSVRRALQQRD